MAISTDGSIERNFRATSNNVIDMHAGKRERLWRPLLDTGQKQPGT